MTATEKLKLVAYGRVSTAAQMDGYGPQIQTDDLRKWVRTNGHTLVGPILFDGGVSGTVEASERPELSKALSLIAAGKADGILVPNLDRLARELSVQEAALSVIWARGGRAFTVDQGEVLRDSDDDPARRFIRQVMGAAAEFERGLIVKRLKAGLATKRAAGGYAGGAPAYGMQAVGKELHTDDIEAEVVTRIHGMRTRGMSFRAIADRLNEDGIPTKRGARWQPYTVARIVSPDARQADRERSSDRYARIKQEKEARKLGKAAHII